MKKFTDTQQKSYASGRRKRNARKGVAVVAIKMKLKKGDMVVVVSGKDKGKQGEIAEVLRLQNRVVIDGVNIVKRHMRKTGRGQSGRIIERPASVHASNVMLLDPSSKKPTRIGRSTEGGKTVRVAKKSKTTLK